MAEMASMYVSTDLPIQYLVEGRIGFWSATVGRDATINIYTRDRLIKELRLMKISEKHLLTKY